MNKKYSILILIVTLLTSREVFSAPWAHCRGRLEPSKITVNEIPITYSTDFTRSVKWLTKRSKSNEPGRVTLGLTESKLSYRITHETATVKPFKSLPECMRVHLIVTLSYNPMKVYVAEKYKRGSCQFKHVWEHELRHVHAYRLHLVEARRALEQELRSIIKDPYYVFDEPGLGRKYLQVAINDFWVPRIEEYIQGARPRHEAIDSWEEREKTDAACEGKWWD